MRKQGSGLIGVNDLDAFKIQTYGDPSPPPKMQGCLGGGVRKGDAGEDEEEGLAIELNKPSDVISDLLCLERTNF